MPSNSYCQYRALECQRKAAEATDDQIRRLMLRNSDAWVRVGNRVDLNREPAEERDRAATAEPFGPRHRPHPDDGR